ncbi:MAG: M28 family peptidase [Woeseiaceae bacterium]|nr:M28 family peptidase [Woeseiaceae bacterium]
MKHRKRAFTLKPGLASLCLLASVVHAQDVADIPEAVRENVELLIQNGLDDNVGYEFVRDLTTEVGQRLAGSEAEERARIWSTQKLAELGFANIRTEPFKIPYWSRRVDKASIVSPAPQDMVISALGGSTSTPPGGVEAEVIRFESMGELRAASTDVVSDKIVFIDEKMTRTQDGSGYGMAVRKRRNCATTTSQKGGLACLIRSVGTQSRRFAHTGMMFRSAAVGDGPAAALSPPDAEQLTRLLENGPVKVRLEIEVETQPEAPSGNVIAEVVGRERPEEIVLIGCHLDSWDLGTGAVDDGAGCGIVVGAAHLIMSLDEAPRRTIRVVLYGAEEVGLLGGFAYAKRHADEMDQHILAAESDFGADKIWRFETRFGDRALPYARAIQRVLEPLGISPGHNLASGGPDISMLPRLGVPVVTPRQNGWDYFDLHHTPDDTFDKIDQGNLNQNIAAYAAFAYLAAEMDWDFRE